LKVWNARLRGNGYASLEVLTFNASDWVERARSVLASEQLRVLAHPAWPPWSTLVVVY